MAIVDNSPGTAVQNGNHPTTGVDLDGLVVSRIRDHIERNFPGEMVSVLVRQQHFPSTAVRDRDLVMVG